MSDDAQRCEELRREHETRPWRITYCRCDHDHPSDASWCYVCEYPLPGPGQETA